MIFEQIFQDRLAEIEEYLSLLQAIETELQSGPPAIGSSGTITAGQQKMLYSSLYVQLYNLVEATVSKSLEAVSKAISDEQTKPADLSVDLMREWVRYSARTHTDLNYENRLTNSLKLCDHLLRTLPVSQLEFEKSGGSWDFDEIRRITNRIGCRLTIAQDSLTAIQYHVKDDMGTLGFIAKMRNELAHGSISFMECGENVTVAHLRDLTERTKKYLSDVVSSFKLFIEQHHYLQPDRRPTGSLA